MPYSCGTCCSTTEGVQRRQEGGGHNYAGTDRDLLCRSRKTMFRKESKSVSQVEAQAKEPQSSGELLKILKAVCILGSSLLII